MQEISQDYQVSKGDVIEFHYRILSIFEQNQINCIIDKINQDGRMEVIAQSVQKTEWYNPIDILIIRGKILKNPFPILILVGAVAVFGSSVFVYLSLDKVYLIFKESPIFGGVLIYGVLGVIGLYLITRLKR